MNTVCNYYESLSRVAPSLLIVYHFLQKTSRHQKIPHYHKPKIFSQIEITENLIASPSQKAMLCLQKKSHQNSANRFYNENVDKRNQRNNRQLSNWGFGSLIQNSPNTFPKNTLIRYPIPNRVSRGRDSYSDFGRFSRPMA